MSEAVAFARRLLTAFQTRDAAILLAMCFASDLGLSVFQVPFAVALVQVHGWEAVDLSRLQAGVALGGGTLGTAGLGTAVDRIGPHRALRALLVAGAVAFGIARLLIGAGLEAATGPVILGLASVVPALLYVALLPTVLLARRTGQALATQFQVYLAAMNFGDVVGSALAGGLAAVMASTFIAATVAVLFLVSARVAPRFAGGGSGKRIAVCVGQTTDFLEEAGTAAFGCVARRRLRAWRVGPRRLRNEREGRKGARTLWAFRLADVARPAGAAVEPLRYRSMPGPANLPARGRAPRVPA